MAELCHGGSTMNTAHIIIGNVYSPQYCSGKIKIQTRMVPLPATAAIEYVAAVNACLMYIISSV